MLELWVEKWEQILEVISYVSLKLIEKVTEYTRCCARLYLHLLSNHCPFSFEASVLSIRIYCLSSYCVLNISTKPFGDSRPQNLAREPGSGLGISGRKGGRPLKSLLVLHFFFSLE